MNNKDWRTEVITAIEQFQFTGKYRIKPQGKTCYVKLWAPDSSDYFAIVLRDPGVSGRSVWRALLPLMANLMYPPLPTGRERRSKPELKNFPVPK